MELFLAGDKIRVRKPLDISEYPIWVSSMDGMDGEVYTVGYCDDNVVEVNEKIWSLDPKWCTKIELEEDGRLREMDELNKWRRINECESIIELEEAIIAISDPATKTIRGRTKEYSAEKMASRVKDVVGGYLPVNILTRSYGIRQQAIYLRTVDCYE